jgi:hypothetical protein
MEEMNLMMKVKEKRSDEKKGGALKGNREERWERMRKEQSGRAMCSVLYQRKRV